MFKEIYNLLFAIVILPSFNINLSIVTAVVIRKFPTDFTLQTK